MRRRIYEIVQRAQPGDGISRAYDVFIVVVAFISIVPLMFKEMGPWLNIVDVVTVYILFLDYILRWMTHDIKTGEKGWKAFAKYPFTPLAIIDLLAILPSLRILPESFKFLRILRIVKMFRYSKNLMLVGNVFVSERRTLLSVLFVAVAYIFVSGLIMFTNEPETFDTFFDALYWATTALTTVGYGDVYPLTELGKGISMVSSLFGIAVIALPAGIITGGFLEEIRKRQSDGEAYFKRHDQGVFKGRRLSDYEGVGPYMRAHPKVVYYAGIMALGVVLSIVLYMAASTFGLPFWLDTTGTALVAFLLEPAAGLIVGYINNLILATVTADAGNLLYFALTAIVALVYGGLFARGKKVTASSVVWAVVLLVFVSAGISTLLSYALDGGVPDTASEQLYWQTMIGWGMPGPLACFLSLALDRVIDNAAVFVLVFALTRFVKRRDFAAEALVRAGGGRPQEVPIQALARYAMGIDVGGTTTKVGIFTLEGELVKKDYFPTNAVRDDSALSVIKAEFDALLASCGIGNERIRMVGLAVPGMLAAEDNLRLAPNVDLDLRAYKAFLISEFPAAHVTALNDANAAILGDKWRGSMSELGGKNVVFLTLGTGVGGGVIMKGSLVEGAHGSAGEIGHLCVDLDSTRRCNCGRTGCLEQHASASALIRRANELGGDFGDAKAVFDASLQGDGAATAAVKEFTKYLAYGLAQLACMFDPDVFILGGGLSLSHDAYLEELRRSYRECVLMACRETPIITTKLGNDCGIYGAAYHAIEALKG